MAPVQHIPMPSPSTLAPYRAKRKFSNTPEPAGDAKTGADTFRFVIQKHWASHLHYDFRLELDGTMKSWAVPKGPSLDPGDKRMAVQVEDHPVAYADFEGTIPPPQYGAGKVAIWDRGHWTPVGDPRAGYAKGNLKFVLHGHKLAGKWVLVRMKGKREGQPPWLLIKESDHFARAAAEFSVVDERPESVASGSDAWTIPLAMPQGAVKRALPKTLVPQLAVLARTLPADVEAWFFEIKFDGYRLLTRVDGDAITLYTRNGNNWTHKLAPLHDALASLGLPDGWYDGEIVVPAHGGVPAFAALQKAFDSGKTRDIVLYLFDLPFVAGYDLRAVRLEERRTVLQGILAAKASDTVRFSQAFDASLETALTSACKLGLEGVIAKRRDAGYASHRSATWIKLKCGQRQEFVVGGYTNPQGTRTGIGALLLGVYDRNGILHFAGKVGSGFSEQALKKITKDLKRIPAETSPFSDTSDIEREAHWVQPRLVAEVSFSEWTPAGRIRHAVFLGLRADKDAQSVVRERVVTPHRAAAKAVGTASSSFPARLRVSHPDRVIDVASGTTKVDLVRYYGLVAPLMMEHLRARPVSLVRAPDGVAGELFFQKHAPTDKLPGIRQLDAAMDPGHPALLEIATRQGLLSASQWNVVEFHTHNFSMRAPAHPDRMVFDLDPGTGVLWTQVQEAAELVRAFLAQLGLVSFLKTSGGKGLHVVVPLRRVYGWDTVKNFSHAIVCHLAQTIPTRFVARSGPRNRVGRIFVDYLRNGLAATTVSAWSARARLGLGISVPVEWSELGMLKGGDHWHVATVHSRLDRGNDPWRDYVRSAQSLKKAMHRLNYPP